MHSQHGNQAVTLELQRYHKLIQEGKHLACEDGLRALQAANPLLPSVNYCLGVLYMETGRMQDAAPFFRRAVAADPGFVAAISNLGLVMAESGDLREALRYAQMALRRQPNSPGMLLNLANVLKALGKFDEAIAAYRDALQLDPDLQSARASLVNTLELAELDTEAVEEAQRLLSQPDTGYHLAALVAIVNHASNRTRWDLLDRYLPELAQAIRKPNQSGIKSMRMTLYEDDPVLLRHLGESQAVPPIRSGMRSSQWQGGIISIGLLSPDLREHPVPHMLLPVLEAHDRSKVRVVLVATKPAEDVPVIRRLKDLADATLDISGLDDGDACLAMQKAGIDILVDVCGVTRWNRTGILARHPCQAQVLWLGCPVTTGAAYYEAFLVDAVAAPAGYEQHCTEPLLRLPCSYHPITCGLTTEARPISRTDLGIPDGVTVIGLMQQPRKITPQVVDRVVATVAAIPNCHLALRIHPDAVDQVRERVLRLGLPTERLHILYFFTSRESYLAALGCIDLIVDTWPYGGHSTTGEALIGGTPVIALAGRSLHARVAASMLHELGLDDLTATDLDGLMALLGRLAADRSALAQTRNRLVAAASAYRDGGIRRLAGALEDAYAEVLRRTAAPAA